MWGENTAGGLASIAARVKDRASIFNALLLAERSRHAARIPFEQQFGHQVVWVSVGEQWRRGGELEEGMWH